jgi:hypothetical protein
MHLSNDSVSEFIVHCFIASSLHPGKVDSGSFSGERQPEPVRPGGVFVLGQDQVHTYCTCFVHLSSKRIGETYMKCNLAAPVECYMQRA